MTTHHLRRHVGAIVQIAASGLLLVGTTLPWVHSGARDIDLYELRRVAYRLEADVDLRLVDGVVLVPLVLAAALLARWAGRPLVGRVFAASAGLYTALGAALMISSPLPTGAGVVVAGLGAVALIAGVAVEWTSRHLRSASPTAEVDPVAATPHLHDPHGSERPR